MTLIYRPQHTTEHPARVEDENGYGYTVTQDTVAPDPRGEVLSNVVIWRFAADRNTVDDPMPEHPVVGAFANFYELYDADTALKMARRFNTIFLAGTVHHARLVTIRTLDGYSQSDWCIVLVVIPADVADTVEQADEWARTNVELYRKWLYGDVWRVTPDDDGESVGGFFAEDEEDAVAQYVASYGPLGPDPNAWLYTEDDAEDEGFDKVDPTAPVNGPIRVHWKIDVDESPCQISLAEAAKQVWEESFGRQPGIQPGPGEACEFTVFGPEGCPGVTVDLSDEKYAILFEQ